MLNSLEFPQGSTGYVTCKTVRGRSFGCDKSQYLGSEQKLLFGQWEMRIFFEYFEKDDILLDSYKIPYIRKIYHGKHEWKIWSQFFFEFVQIIFKEK